MKLSIQQAAMILCTAVATLVPDAAPATVTIDGDTPWVVMQADFDNPAIQEAIRDAERDWYKVFG